jgi:hypothetical protein
MSQKKDEPPDFDKTMALISEWLDRGGLIDIGDHLKVYRAERNISRRDCLYMLRNGWFSWPPEWDDQRGNWVFHVGGEDLDGELLELLFVIKYARGTFKFITAKPLYRKEG